MTTQRDKTSAESTKDVGQIHELTKIVDDLIGMMSDGNIGSLKLEYGELRLSLQSKDRVTKHSTPDEPAVTSSSTPNVSKEAGPVANGHVVSAPMIGTFYVAPAPNEPPFVQPGDTVVEGQTIGIIEAMKIMNEIASDRSGIVVEILAVDGQTVEYGSPLVRVEPSAE